MSCAVALCMALGISGQQAVAAEAAAESDAIKSHTPEPDKPKTGPGLSFIPFGGYSTDFGLEGGALASFYWFARNYKPYALRVDTLVFTSTRLQSYFFVSFDAPTVAGLPLRLGGRLGLANALSENYCGMAMRADCGTQRAEEAADHYLADRNLTGHSANTAAAKEELARKYYWYRLTAPTLGLYGRYNLTSSVQLFARYDLTYFIPNAYPVSRLQEDMPYGSRRGGTSSVPQIGLILDTRDFEPAPTSGTFSEATVRVSSNVLGSGYNWIGLNTTVRLYVPMTPDRRMVFAMRFIADLMFGDVPFYEQGYFGGTDSLNGIGGERGGRGMRFQRYRGKGRFLWTPEIRATWVSFTLPVPVVGPFDIDLATVTFADIGKVISEWPQVSVVERQVRITDHDDRPFTELVYGLGVGTRMIINKIFILKADFAWSPVEQNPGIYLNVNHVF